MHSFPIHSPETAPEASRPLLQALEQAIGMVPNLAAGMSEAPSLLSSFLTVGDIYRKGSFPEAEIQALALVAARENACDWCLAFHTMMAKKAGVPDDAVQALRQGRAPSDSRLAQLTQFARELVRRRGAVPPEQVQRFLDAGFTQSQALEIVLGMAWSSMANYSAHLVNPSLDAPLEPFSMRASDAA